ncbi:MAG TPA: hypothetical protein PKC84_08350 [Paracoccaceae bacterium]|nr:hypothetical protein [Paracoccaceae bacterium]
MAALVWAGVAMTVAGLAGIVWCLVQGARARRGGMAEPALRALMQRIVVVNMAAFGVAALGLGAMVAGILLG